MFYRHLNKVLISKSAIKHNFKLIQKLHPEAKICPVLKSNAYGHGLIEAASVFDSLDTPFLIVDSLYEAYELYKLNVKTSVLLLGYTNPQNFKVKKLPFHHAIYDLGLARVLNEFQGECKVHIFVDSGMNREGVMLGDLRDFVKEIKKLKNLEVEGVCSHFADADNSTELAPTMVQAAAFKDAIRILADEGINPKWRHVSASAGALRIKDPIFNMLRVGLASYGINPFDKWQLESEIKLKPVLRFISTIVQLKEIKKGDKVGYNFTFEAKSSMKIAILAAGYYEGVDRRLSNKGYVKVGNDFCPILGKVSMNMTTIDVSNAQKPKVGQKVTIYSDQDADKNSIYNSAALCSTVPYEIFTKISESVRRELV